MGGIDHFGIGSVQFVSNSFSRKLSLILGCAQELENVGKMAPHTLSNSTDEKTPLVGSGGEQKRRLKNYAAASINADQLSLEKSGKEDKESRSVHLERHITGIDCVLIILGNVLGSGIFISPKSTLEHLGSPGAALITWALTGLVTLIQAMCYAELGTMIPKSGGDYVYIYEILGPLAGFVCAWTHVMIVAASANAVMCRVAGVYILKALGLECNESMAMSISVLIIIMFATLNSLSSKLGTRIQGIFSLAKVTALAIVISAGLWNLFQGHTYNFQPEHVWEGTNLDPTMIAMGAMDSYFAFKGWELVNTLPEEMINPKRDLPRAVIFSMLTSTGLYVLINVAYLTGLSPLDMIHSDAVAITFMEATFGSIGKWMVVVSVAMCSMGTINGSFLSDTKYMFAAGRVKQFPPLFAMIQLDFLTPISALIFLAFMSIVYSVIPNAEMFQSYTSLAVQIKIMMGMVALLVLRWKEPNMERPVKVPLVLVVFTLLLMVVLICLSLVANPMVIGLGIAILLAAVPLYYLTALMARSTLIQNMMDKITLFTQLMFKVILECSNEEGDYECTLEKSH